MDKRKPVSLLGVAYCEGAPDRRCQFGPEAVRALLTERGLLEPGALTWRASLSLADNRIDGTVALYSRVAEGVAQGVAAGEFMVVFGGDHSCAIGTWSGAAKALAAQGPLGLIWIDAHMDSHTPATSPSGALHGMPVAVLLGQGRREYIDIAFQGPKVKPSNLCLVGVRSYEAAEQVLLERLGVKVFGMNDIHRLGLTQVLAQAREIATRGTAGYGLSIDLDSIDPRDAPGVGSPAVGGIGATELLDGLTLFQADTRLVALEVAELNPVMDVERQTTGLAVEIVERVIAPESEENGV